MDSGSASSRPLAGSGMALGPGLASQRAEQSPNRPIRCWWAAGGPTDKVARMIAGGHGQTPRLASDRRKPARSHRAAGRVTERCAANPTVIHPLFPMAAHGGASLVHRCRTTSSATSR